MIRLEDPLATTENCRYCLMCRHMCPVGHLTHREALTPHGWGLTIASVRRGQQTWNAATVANLYACADCGNCRSHCVTDQPLPAAIAAARAEVVAARLAPPTVYALADQLRQWGNPYAARAPETAVAGGDTAVFIGDATVHLWPTLVPAVMRLVKTIGIAAVAVAVGRNNGYLPSSLGLPEIAADLIRATLDEVRASGARRVIVLAPGDRFALGRMAAERLGVEWPSDVELVELAPLLAAAVVDGRLTLKQRPAPETAYVDPTHAPRVPGRHAAPRQLLTAVDGRPPRELFFRAERAHPAGDVALAFTQPDLARRLTAARLAGARDAGARRVVTEDPATLAHLQQYAADFDLTVAGLYEHLADALPPPEAPMP